MSWIHDFDNTLKPKTKRWIHLGAITRKSLFLGLGRERV
jgi:hypothetical protein